VSLSGGIPSFGGVAVWNVARGNTDWANAAAKTASQCLHLSPGPAPGPAPGGSCECIPCGSSTPATWSSGSCSPASGQCGPSVGGSGCYTDCGSSCDCGSHTCSS
jgi:hypothetical protein